MNIAYTGSILQYIKDGMAEGNQYIDEAKMHPEVAKASLATNTFATGDWTRIGFKDKANTNRQFKFNVVGHDYVETMGMELIAGRDFDPDNVSDSKHALIVNEAFIKAFQLENAIGTSFYTELFGDNKIIGVVSDFNFESLRASVDPLVLSMNHKPILQGANDLWLDSDVTPKAVVALSPGQIKAGLTVLETKWSELNPSAPFEFEFVDDQLAMQYETEQKLGYIVDVATFIIIFISSLGLLSLATLTINGRLKEIGIRKVLGAPLADLLVMLGKEYFLIVVISSVLSIPLVVIFMNDWLNNFAYRIDIGITPFILGFMLIALTSIFTVGFKVIRTALLNPAVTLKDE